MRRSFVAGAVAGLVLASVSAVWAKGIFITPGARANALGGAYVAIADDPTAIYWNPAGLGRLEGRGAELSAFYVSDSAKSNVSPVATSTEFKTTALVPFAAGFWKIDEYVVAAGIYGSGGGGGKFEDTILTFPYSIDATVAYSIYNVSIARQFGDKLSVGVGIDMVNVTDKRTLTGPNGFFTATVTQKTETSGSGLQVNAGAIYVVNEALDLGAVIRTGSRFDVKGTVSAGGASADIESETTYPVTAAVGASYQAMDKLLIAAGLDWNNYSQMSPRLDDTIQMRAGAEYQLKDKLALRAGIQTDPALLPKGATPDLFNTNQYNMTYITVGAGFTLAGVNFDASIGRGLSDKPSVGGVEFEYPITIYRLGANFAF